MTRAGAAVVVAGLVIGLTGRSWGFWLAAVGLLLTHILTNDLLLSVRTPRDWRTL